MGNQGCKCIKKLKKQGISEFYIGHLKLGCFGIPI